jgi:hypothetical protein
MTWIIRGLLICSLGTLLAAVWLLVQPTPKPALTLVDSVAVLGQIPVGEPHFAVFTFRNDGDAPAQVMNLEPTCSTKVCRGSYHKGPQTIAPQSEAQYLIEVKANAPGEIDIDAFLFVNDRGLRKVPIHISATAIANPEQINASPMP